LFIVSVHLASDHRLVHRIVDWFIDESTTDDPMMRLKPMGDDSTIESMNKYPICDDHLHQRAPTWPRSPIP
jgi:hypothetical protein